MNRDLEAENGELASVLIALVEEGNALSEGGQDSRAIPLYLGAWEKLPEPRTRWELFSAWIAGSLFNSYFDSGLYDEAKRWALAAYDARHKDEVTTEGMIEVGKACFALNQLDEAYAWFKQAFEIDGRRAFDDEDPKYLAFYRRSRPAEHQ
ncbi:MAG: hypothetical protein ABI130_03245 [Leifsonia sp.]